MRYKVMIIIERDEHGYYAYAPELEGCQTQGETLDETLSNMEEAVELYLDTMPESEIWDSLNTAVLTTTIEVAVA
jgi:predicted RNase H-like HicB family nuclease